MDTSQKPLVTISGKKTLFKEELNQRITGDLPQEGIEWRRQLSKNAKTVYVDVDFVDFDIDNVERERTRLLKMKLIDDTINNGKKKLLNGGDNSDNSQDHQQDLIAESKHSISEAFFSTKLLGQPILHTFWTDSSDFESDTYRSQFDEWIGQVQASTCTEWAIVVIDDGDNKGQVGPAMFKSKLQSASHSSNQHVSSSSTSAQNTSLLDRIKTGLSTMFQHDSNSERWLSLLVQTTPSDVKAQDSYNNFMKRLRNLILASFSKQIELFEEQLRVQREMRTLKEWNFFSYFIIQEELAFAFEFLTLFDDALVQYDLLDALFSDLISSPDIHDELWIKPLMIFSNWNGLCLESTSEHTKMLRRRIVDKEASLLELRSYLFSRQCDLMLLQNQPWKVAASTLPFLHTCVKEHELLEIETIPGGLICWVFTSALEVLQKCECYSCTSQMENYSLHTVDIWNYSRIKLMELGDICHLMPNMEFGSKGLHHIVSLISGMGLDPHAGRSISNQSTDVSPQARLKNALAGQEQFLKQLVEISELTMGTYKHIGRKRHAMLVGRELAELYIKMKSASQALPFLLDLEKVLESERWPILLDDAKKRLVLCNSLVSAESALNISSDGGTTTSDQKQSTTA